MADNEQTTVNPNNASRTDAPLSDTHNERHDREGTSNPVHEEPARQNYVHNLEDEVMMLREYKRQAESRTSQQPRQTFGNVQSSPSQSSKHCSFKSFMASKPPEFHGGNNPTATVNWLRDMERKFDVTCCEDEFKVSYAVQCMKDEAMVWWDSVTGHLSQQQRDSISWNDFRNAVYNQYCSDFDMARIRREFTNLELTGNMTIEDLISQFSDKLRFVHQWVPDERARVESFLDTLPPNYRTSVRFASSLSHAFNLARAVDNDIRAQNLQVRDTSSSRDRGDSSSKGKSRWQHNRQGKKSGNRSGFSGISVSSNWCSTRKSKHNGPCTA